MHIYSTGQWVLLFFFYCFCGWIWESCYVSVLQKRWVNRGFLNGPVLPIYGSGAILVLFVTLPVKDNLWLVAILGMIAATILEYVTGAVMEKLFKVRYWDYSKQKFQLNGYICLSSSIAWGFFSVMMVKYLHPPVERLLGHVPDWVVDPLALILAVVFTVDVVQSTQAALDLRDVLTRLAEENEDFRILAKRAEVVAAFAEDDLKQFREKTQLDKLMLQLRVEEGLEAGHQMHKAVKMKRKERLEYMLNKRMEVRLGVLDEISKAIEHGIMSYSELNNITDEKKEDLRDLISKIRDRKQEIGEHTNKKYRRALRMIHANPSAKAKDFQDIMESLRKIDKDN